MTFPGWAAQVDPEGLSQGDVLEPLPVVSLWNPISPISKNESGKGVRWLPSSEPSQGSEGYFVARGARLPVLVLSDCCELDKERDRERVIVAAIRPLNTLQAADQQTVRDGKNFSYAPLLNIPEYGDCYANFRLTVSLRKESVDTARRVASMTDSGRRWLYGRIFGYYARKKLPEFQ